MILAVLTLFTFPFMASGDSGFTVGPPSVSVTVPVDGEGTANVYITSGFDGEIVIGTENIPFRVEPETVSVSSADKSRKIELRFYGEESAEEGTYSGKLTFLAYTTDNLGFGVKINAEVTQLSGGLEGGIAEAGDDKENIVSDTTTKYYLVIIIGVLAIVALFAGILIGKGKKKET
jgi:hypothetical protein